MLALDKKVIRINGSEYKTVEDSTATLSCKNCDFDVNPEFCDKAQSMFDCGFCKAGVVWKEVDKPFNQHQETAYKYVVKHKTTDKMNVFYSSIEDALTAYYRVIEQWMLTREPKDWYCFQVVSYNKKDYQPKIADLFDAEQPGTVIRSWVA